MSDFIMNNIDTIGAILISVVMAVYAIVTHRWSMLQVAAYRLMLSAERLLGTKPGKAKMDEVFTEIWKKIPKWVKRFVSEKTLREKLQKWYDLAKDDLREQAGL